MLQEEERVAEAAEALATALAALGVIAQERRDGRTTMSVHIGKTQPPVALSVQPEAVISTGRAVSMIDALKPSERPETTIVVADEISAGARRLLTEAGFGWLDRRGHLRVWVPPIMLDSDVPNSRRPGARAESADPIKGRGGLAFAIELLLAPDAPPTLSEIAHRGGLAVSSVSVGAAAVRAAGLLRSDGRPLIPELFHSVAEAWQPAWHWLAEPPHPKGATLTDPLGFGFDDLEADGWALTDSRAAAGWNAPLVVSSAIPPTLYVPNERILRRAISLYGVGTTPETSGARIAVAPLPMVCRPRYDVPGEVWPGTNPLFVALDLAQDPARGAEALDHWQPPTPFSRVW
jgi:hypothetical protein